MDEKALRKSIGRHLQAARKAAGYKSSSAFAESIGMAPSAYVEYEQGRVAMSVETAWVVADKLGLSIDTLVGRASEASFSDLRQQALNGYYESMNDAGRAVLVESARLMADGDSVRVQKNGRAAGVPPEMEGVA